MGPHLTGLVSSKKQQTDDGQMDGTHTKVVMVLFYGKRLLQNMYNELVLMVLNINF